MVKFVPDALREKVRIFRLLSTPREKTLLGIIGILSIFLLALIIALGCSNGTSHIQTTDIDYATNAVRSLFAELVSDAETIGGQDRVKIPVSENNLLAHFQKLTAKVHVGGTPENEDVANYIHRTWQEQGLDNVQFSEYNGVLLSYPDYDNPSTIHYSNASGTHLLSSGLGSVDDMSSDGAKEAYRDKRARVWWNAYSPPGEVTSTLIYANYASDSDFQYLDRSGINVEGKIVLCRYGKAWRGAKVYEATKRGAIGVIIFSDLAGYAEAAERYPNGVRMPEGGAQRGTATRFNGDPLTPMFPALNYTYRWNTAEDLRSKDRDYLLPSIPVTPISYADALKLLTTMEGTMAPSDWSTPMSSANGVSVFLDSGPHFQGKITLKVNTKDRKAKIRNVIGRIRGSTDPDKFVVMSNHYDAWTYGAHDPNSATTIMLEISRMFTEAIQRKQWRPKRSIIFAAWDAEEFGLVGSNEWIEEKLKDICRNAVALVNVDFGVGAAGSFGLTSAPLLYRSAVKATANVPNPLINKRPQQATIYDDWNHMCPEGPLPQDPTVPRADPPGGGSDDHYFMTKVGVPTMWLSYWGSCDPNVLGIYELYHTMFETPWLHTQYVDPDHLKIHRALAQVTAEIVLDLADATVIPFNTSDYAVVLDHWLDKQLLQRIKDNEALSGIIENFNKVDSGLRDAAQRFIAAAKKFQNFVDTLKSTGGATNQQKINTINNRLVALERSFIQEGGLSFLQEERHVIFSIARSNAYASSLFNSILDNYADYATYMKSGNKQKAEEHKKLTNLQLTSLQWSIESAISTLDLSNIS